MKKFAIILLIVLSSFVLVGCNTKLTKANENKIKEFYSAIFCNNQVKIEDIIIEKYYGEYNGFEVVLIKELQKADSGAEKYITIDGIVFYYPYGNREILLWTGEKFFDLSDAFENNLISTKDLLKINKIHNEYYSY